jgi:hypothetical protein
MVLGAAVVLVVFGRYQLVSSERTWMYRLDRYTGDVSYSVSGKAWRSMANPDVVPVDVVVTESEAGLLVDIKPDEAACKYVSPIGLEFEAQPDRSVMEKAVRGLIAKEWPGIRTHLRWVRK